MNQSIERMLDRYQTTTLAGRELALREIMQELVLLGLNRGRFFEQAAFYGGTALRVFYGLDRFSEDLDFTLNSEAPLFSWGRYSRIVEEELSTYGFVVTMLEKEKSQKSAIKSAFLKANTFQELMKIGVPQGNLHGFHPDTTIRIKIEIDTAPAILYETEERYLREPVPTSIRCVTEECLFVGKMHATLFRQWRNRVKGRDWYDMIWFIRRGTVLNLSLFSAMMGKTQPITSEEFLDLAKERISTLDIESAKLDIRVFIRDERDLNDWSRKFFLYWIDQVKFTYS